MLKKLLLISSVILSLFSFIYPAKKENTKLFDYCYSLEKILVRNSIEKRENVSFRMQSFSKDIAKLGLSKTRGSFINKMIDKYKKSKNYFLINIVPNEIYCFTGYWIDKVNPGTFEKIFYEKSKRKINEFEEIKDGLHFLLKK